MREVADLAMVSGISARHLTKILDGEAIGGEHHKRWATRRLTKEEARAVTNARSKKSIAVDAMAGNVHNYNWGKLDGYKLIHSCPPQCILPGDLLALAIYGGWQWVEVISIDVDDSAAHLKIGDVAVSLRPQDYMRVLRRIDND